MRLENGIEQDGLLLWRAFDLNVESNYELSIALRNPCDPVKTTSRDSMFEFNVQVKTCSTHDFLKFFSETFPIKSIHTYICIYVM